MSLYLDDVWVEKFGKNGEERQIVLKIGDTEERMTWYLGENPRGIIKSLLRMAQILSEEYTEDVQ